MHEWMALTVPSQSGSSTFQRHLQKKASSSVRTWVERQSLEPPPKDNTTSDTVGTPRTTKNDGWRVFAPSSSPTSTKRGSSQVSLQLPSPAPSPPKPQPKPKSVSTTAGQTTSTRNGRSAPVPEYSDVEVLSSADDEDGYDRMWDEDQPNADANEDESEDKSECQSETESELSGNVRMRASKYLDISAQETRGIEAYWTEYTLGEANPVVIADAVRGRKEIDGQKD
ncbi:hypothetical protein FRC08_000853 [Ceratobasidium sp. 394]|nr:hypothetical protein FRC08_000853 [Ceratobasidium sp. 394]